MAMVTRIDPYSQLATGRKLRTCAYCRVSSNSADQLHSYAAQVKYYTKAIKERSDWEFVDVFADEGINLIRRLTPLECERLQGFPDYFTDIPDASDSARYKALGNSVAIPCVDFLMEAIVLHLAEEAA